MRSTNQTVEITLNADATVTYACINGGGKHLKATNKETVNGPESQPGFFNSGKNGTVSNSLSVSPLGPGFFSCQKGHRLVLAKGSYTNVTLKDSTNNVTANIPGTFTKIFFSF